MASLTVLQPVARWWGRTRHWQAAQRQATAGRQRLAARLVGRRVVLITADRPRAELTESIIATLRASGYNVSATTGWEDHDGRVSGSLLVDGGLQTSEHPPGTLQTRVRIRLRLRPIAVVAVTVAAVAMLASWRAAVVLCALAVVDLAFGCWRLGPRLRARGFEIDGQRGLTRNLRVMPRAFAYLRPYRRLATTGAVLTVLIAIVELAAPWPLALVIDSVVGDRAPMGAVQALGISSDVGLIAVAVAASVVVMLVAGVLRIANDYVTNRVDRGMGLDLRSDLVAHTQRLSMSFHDSATTGDLLFKINEQAEAVGKVVVAVPTMAQGVLTLLGMFAIVYHIDPQLALLSACVVPFVLWSTAHYANRIEPELHRVRAMESANLTIVHQSLTMLRVIMAFGREDHAQALFDTQGDASVSARLRLTVRQAMFNVGVSSLTALRQRWWSRSPHTRS